MPISLTRLTLKQKFNFSPEVGLKGDNHLQMVQNYVRVADTGKVIFKQNGKIFSMSFSQLLVVETSRPRFAISFSAKFMARDQQTVVNSKQEADIVEQKSQPNCLIM